MKVFGIGWAKTGTTSLGTALSRLGFNHKTQDFDFVDAFYEKDFNRIFDLTDKYDSFEDWPWLLLYEEFFARYPDAKFILTIREEISWIKSYQSMLADQGKASPRMNEIRQKLYGLPFPNVTEQQLIARYRKHNEDILSFFSDKPEKLLVVDWSKGDGYKELCEFLGVGLIDEPFPHANKATERKKSNLLSRITRRLSQKSLLPDVSK
ncbi:hypothetical protein MD273_05175 [Marinobacter pelagius]|uniref:sulfotransferase family protein n=1 Tax=Marinobacter sp. C7 TaxID=2951363 RepID=UPI001EF0E1B5|nr:sulfotransferase family protein [Marinobacter sp. C7]MCG7199118.1 hypothetical protein [Marinobacter sp. C7]